MCRAQCLQPATLVITVCAELLPPSYPGPACSEDRAGSSDTRSQRSALILWCQSMVLQQDLCCALCNVYLPVVCMNASDTAAGAVLSLATIHQGSCIQPMAATSISVHQKAGATVRHTCAHVCGTICCTNVFIICVHKYKLNLHSQDSNR